ncbi:1-(5-phosphoribosyl)-5-[(5-phosphoribosylamino)methylideneamino]imidazole-4-carboxamide isomerase [Bacteroidetes bacterium endosymbiont of Geopemphigus sp.]|uniref:1-(5-phosphoribosyl)-5-[(5- phosphoribosylamino)methylideneamino]imidazole-4- carboxamide isomerase n=1 Tax=Bacteroidetes bacterium endosymbiont of Geopemphigus sp. TaxID=2047937 RepID=UPI000CD03DFD|nr:1-(5-phosphoribosyl)-5-[(5-phosphoribosylamino)methylideneamino]imidazole-4-carboxamide isomerase [Bacteroidetes bacterium endosymbiont of Geopemphigus sp.]
MQIIPAIDLIDGKCVRLIQGDYTQKKIYSHHPLEVALRFEEAGISRLHLVDLDGAKNGKLIHWNILEQLTTHTRLLIDFGGGIQSDQDLKAVFESGAYMATIGSIAVKKPELFKNWIGRYGSEKILLGADVKDEKILIHGWKQVTEISMWEFIKKKIAEGVEQLFCTDIAKDGLLSGPSVNLYRKIIQRFPNLKLIASGGINQLKDLKELQALGCKGAIIGKALYENKIQLSELKNFTNPI